MKKIICLFILIGAVSFSSQKTVYKNQLKILNDLVVCKGDNSIFTGKVVDGKNREYFKKGKAQGKWLTFYENGKLKSIENWSEGNLNGKHIIYRENGTKYVEINYKDGKENGEYKIFYENGKPRVYGKFKKGKPIGEWKVYRKG